MTNTKERHLRIVDGSFIPPPLVKRDPREDYPDLSAEEYSQAGAELHRSIRTRIAQLLDELRATSDGLTLDQALILEFLRDQLLEVQSRVDRTIPYQESITFADRIRAFNRLYQWEIADQVTDENSSRNPTGYYVSCISEDAVRNISTPVVLSDATVKELEGLIKTIYEPKVAQPLKEDDKKDVYTHVVYCINKESNRWFSLNLVKDDHGNVLHIQPVMLRSKEAPYSPLKAYTQLDDGPNYSSGFWAGSLEGRLNSLNSGSNETGQIVWNVPRAKLLEIEPLRLSRGEISIPVFYYPSQLHTLSSRFKLPWNQLVYAVDEDNHLLIINGALDENGNAIKAIAIDYSALTGLPFEALKIQQRTWWGRFLPQPVLARLANRRFQDRSRRELAHQLSEARSRPDKDEE